MKKKSIVAVVLLVCIAGLFAFAACGETGGANSGQNANPSGKTEVVKTGKRVYFAGPMFNQAEKEFNLRLTQVLEDHGYQVFLPQRDGIEGALLDGKTEEELIEMIFPLDVQNVLNADILFMNLDGRVPDEGACVELGIAYANNKRCYGFKTDTRAAERGLELNPMISGCMIKMFKNFDGEKLIEEIEEYLSENAL